MGSCATVSQVRISDGNARNGFSQRAAEDINVDGNRHTYLAPADRVAGVGCDLNYLQLKEKVRFGKVWYPPS
jgi:hypothetical protein